MQLRLEQFCAELDAYAGRIPLKVLTNGLQRLHIDFPALEKFVQFSPERYRRNLFRAGPAYHALILCWRAGQRSPIHDHRGSSCGVRVLRGTCTETIFQRTSEGHIFPTRTRELPEGFCCGSQDADIHQISNLMPEGNDLITLHVYSPPLLVMGQ